VAIPDSDVQFDPVTGNVEMRVTDLPEMDTFNLLRSLGPVETTVFVPATVSFDIVWSGPVTRRVTVAHGTNGDLFSGQYTEEHVSMTWSATNSAGFSFRANRGDFSTSVPGTPFAEVGSERNGIFANADPVRAAAAPQQPVQQTLSAEQLQPVVQQAIASWQTAGASPAQVALLKLVQIHIGVLPSSYLGMQAGRQVWISPNAAGWGWFMDASAASSKAFPATPGSPADGKMDLLSVVSHELGHVLGLEDCPDLKDVMGETLTPGVRRLPTAGDLSADLVQVTIVVPTGGAGTGAGSPRSASSAKGGDQEVAAIVANMFLLPSQTTSAPAGQGNLASATVPVSLAWPPALLAAGGSDQAPTLSLTPREHISSTALLDQVFGEAAAKPLDQDLIGDLQAFDSSGEPRQ
jgi:hypothetical protein